ncbi:MAG TPA: hypothetical protein DIC46_15245, partial [Porphyromonadaceae bacterium]|nr:hypothetical protein [Porphyromonadaceae bacterium]
MKNWIILFSFLVATHVVSAQRTAYHFPPEKLFNQGKEMFLQQNYTGAQDFLSHYIAESNDTQLQEEAEYMIAAAAYYRNTPDNGEVLKEFLDTHPESVHRHQVHFLIGSGHFNKKEWQQAKFRFDQTNIDYLTPREQEDYSFRNAYTNLQLNHKDEATRLFGLLSQNSKTYRDAADFYLGYIEYTNGNYNTAVQRFQRLKDHPEYREDVAFYTAQGTFFDGKPDEAIRQAESFTQNYPNSEHIGEMYRILGNSNYRLGRVSRALPYYEKYLASTEKPLRGDAYFLGVAYFEAQRYNEAIRMFQQTTGERDELTQNAQLHLGLAYLKLGQKQQAQMAFEAAGRDNFDPKVRETALFNYALLAHETNFSVFSESITLFENFLREYPNSPYAEQVNDILAETFLTTNNYEAALSAINRIAKPGRRVLEAKQMILFQLGAQEFINGNMEQAIRLFDQTIQLGNYDAKARNNAYYWRGESHYRKGNYQAAANDFRQFTQNASAADENYALGWYNLGYALFKQRQYQTAVNAFRQYISAETNKSKSELADAYNRIGDSYYYNRSFAEAERFYAQATQISPSAGDYAAYQKAFVMGLQHNYQGKIEALDELMRRYPNSTYYDDALYEKSRALTMAGRENEAIAVLQKLVTDFPNSLLASQAGVQLGQLYYNTGNHQQSIAAYKNVITRFAGSDDARTALISLETVYNDMNDIQSYINYANTLPGGRKITVSRQDSLTYLAAENIYMKGKRNEAQTALQKYLQTYPNGAYGSDANYHLGMIANENGNKQQALSYFRKVIDANSAKYLDNVLLFAAQEEFANKNYEQALADYTKMANAARNAANRQTGQLGVVRTQSLLNRYREAAQAASALLENSNLSPETATEVRYLRAKAYLQLNETDKAVADLQAIAKDTRSAYGAEAQFILADTYYRWKSYD